jgi:hypothetical protein
MMFAVIVFTRYKLRIDIPMRSLIVFSILIFLHNSAAAEWVKISETKRGKSFFVEANEISVQGDSRVVIELIDNKRPDRDGDRSVRVVREYDCKGARYRVKNASYYKSPMAEGEPSMSVEGTMGWTDIDANTPAQAVLDHVCAVK